MRVRDRVGRGKAGPALRDVPGVGRGGQAREGVGEDAHVPLEAAEPFEIICRCLVPGVVTAVEQKLEFFSFLRIQIKREMEDKLFVDYPASLVLELCIGRDSTRRVVGRDTGGYVAL